MKKQLPPAYNLDMTGDDFAKYFVEFDTFDDCDYYGRSHEEPCDIVVSIYLNNGELHKLPRYELLDENFRQRVRDACVDHISE